MGLLPHLKEAYTVALPVDKLIRAKTGRKSTAYLREMIRTKSARGIAVELDVDTRSVLVRLEAMGYVWTSPRGWRKPRKQQEAAA